MARLAALDVGSNALRLRVVEVAAPSSGCPLPPPPWREVRSLRAAVRLGGDVFLGGKLAPASIDRACEALQAFREAMDDDRVDAYRATATSAVREASNAATLIARARREARIDLEVIDGAEEARLVQLAVVRKLALRDRRALLVDVGGGSTELTYLDQGSATWSVSLPIGTVRLLATCLRGAEVVDPARQSVLFEGIDRALAQATPALSTMPFELLVATGGCVTTLCDLCPRAGGHGGYARAVDTGETRKLLATLFTMTAEERRTTFELRPDRADTIVTAASLFVRVAETFGVDAIIAPGAGLAEGIVEDLADRVFGRAAIAPGGAPIAQLRERGAAAPPSSPPPRGDGRKSSL